MHLGQSLWARASAMPGVAGVTTTAWTLAIDLDTDPYECRIGDYTEVEYKCTLMAA
jgi:hypothetical protein